MISALSASLRTLPTQVDRVRVAITNRTTPLTRAKILRATACAFAVIASVSCSVYKPEFSSIVTLTSAAIITTSQFVVWAVQENAATL